MSRPSHAMASFLSVTTRTRWPRSATRGLSQSSGELLVARTLPGLFGAVLAPGGCCRLDDRIAVQP